MENYSPKRRENYYVQEIDEGLFGILILAKDRERYSTNALHVRKFFIKMESLNMIRQIQMQLELA